MIFSVAGGRSAPFRPYLYCGHDDQRRQGDINTDTLHLASLTGSSRQQSVMLYAQYYETRDLFQPPCNRVPCQAERQQSVLLYAQ